MIYETKVQYRKTVDGKDSVVRECYIVWSASCFADAEEQVYVYLNGIDCTDAEVVQLKRSKAREIANSRQYDNEQIWVAELMDTFLNEDGSETQLKYKIFLFAKTFDAAKLFITEYSKQGYDMTLVSLKLTNNVDVIK